MRLGFLTQTITVRSQSGVSTAGDPTFGSKRSVAARVQPGKDRTETAIEHTHVVYAAEELKADDRVWFPGDDVNDESTARRPVSVSAMQHPTQGAIGWKVLF